MSNKENLVEVILTSGEGEEEFRIHYQISREAYQRAVELIEQEKAEISNDRRTELFYIFSKKSICLFTGIYKNNRFI